MSIKLFFIGKQNNIFILDNRFGKQTIYDIIQLKYVEGSFINFRNYYNIKMDGEEESDEIL